jgi:hypothetical protein
MEAWSLHLYRARITAFDATAPEKGTPAYRNTVTAVARVVTFTYTSTGPPTHVPEHLIAAPPGHWQVFVAVAVIPRTPDAAAIAAARIPAASEALETLRLPYCAPARAASATAVAVRRAIEKSSTPASSRSRSGAASANSTAAVPPFRVERRSLMVTR